MSSPYHEASRLLQDRFDTRRLADRLDERFLSAAAIGPDDRAFIERMDMFFLATADAAGRLAEGGARRPWPRDGAVEVREPESNRPDRR